MLYTSDSIVDVFSSIPRRVVSLVPSVTDTLQTMGLSGHIVGITEYCPRLEREAGITRIGGTKTLNVDAILALDPDLVIANQEENSRRRIETLAEEGLTLWLTFPKSVPDVLLDLRIAARLFGISREWSPRIDTLEKAYELCWLAQEDHPRIRVFCPIWVEKDDGGFMTFTEDTYANEILQLCGARNVFADGTADTLHPQKAGNQTKPIPTGGDGRYPRVATEEIVEAAPELILLPSEPYPFSPKELDQTRELLRDTPAVEHNNIRFIDGRLITWHGTYTAQALTILPALIEKNRLHLPELS